MDPFYEFMDIYLRHNRHCPDCGVPVWVAYGDGHVWDKCFDCSEPTASTSLDLAGYITRYPVPTEPLPEHFEVRQCNGDLFPSEEHERAYRIKNIESINT